MEKIRIKVEFGYSVENKDRCSIEKGEVLNMLRLTIFKGGVANSEDVGNFLIKEIVKRQEDDSITVTKTKVLLDSFGLKLNKLFCGCIFPLLRKYNMKDIELELVDAEDLDNKLPFLYDALKIAGVKDYKRPFNRSGFYTLEEVEKQVWKFDSETFKRSLNITSIIIK